MKHARVRTAMAAAALAALHAMLSGRALADTFQVTKPTDAHTPARILELVDA